MLALAPTGLAHAFSQSSRTPDTERAAKRTSVFPVDQRTYLQSNATYYQRLQAGGEHVSPQEDREVDHT